MAVKRIISNRSWRLVTKSSSNIAMTSFLNLKFQSLSNSPSLDDCDSLISLGNLFQRYGFSPSQVPVFLKKHQFLLTSGQFEIQKSLDILFSFNPSRDFVVSVINACPSILQVEFLEKWRLGIANLGVSNITPLAVENVLRIARNSKLNPDEFLERLNCLKNLGFSEGAITRVLETVPSVIVSSDDEIRAKIELLMRIQLSKREIDGIFRSSPEILSFGVNNRLRPLFDEFKELGFSLTEVKREVIQNPKVLGLENGEISQCVEMLRKLKCRKPIKDSILRDGEFRAGYRVKLRIDCLRKHGVIYKDAFYILWKEPRVILYDIEDIEKKFEFLIHETKFDVQNLVEVPEYLGINFDKQIVPRFSVVDYLSSNGMLGEDVCFRNLVKLTRLRFYNLYVKPYRECEKMYGRFGKNIKAKSQHPIGIWKLMKPQQYQNSDEDAENIKSFMESSS